MDKLFKSSFAVTGKFSLRCIHYCPVLNLANILGTVLAKFNADSSEPEGKADEFGNTRVLKEFSMKTFHSR